MENALYNSLGDLDQLLNHDWRWMFRDDAEKWVNNLKQTLHGITPEQVSMFYRGIFDAKIEGEEIAFVKTNIDLADEIVQWMLKRLVEYGEGIECYFEGMTKPENLVSRADFDDYYDYEEELESTRTTYRNHYDREVAAFRLQKASFEWVNRNWFNGKLQFPTIRSFKQMQNDLKISDLRCNDFKKVNDHALLMTVDGEVFWCGEEIPYSALQHVELHRELRKLNVNSIDNVFSGECDICYDPHHHWRFDFFIHPITFNVIFTAIQSKLD